MKNGRRLLAALLVVMLVALTGCSKGNETSQGGEKDQAKFDPFLEDPFRENVQSDSISLHYTLAHPENYGITDMEPTLGEYSEESFRENLEDAKETLEELGQFDYESLTEAQQLSYDIMEHSLNTTIEGESYFLYDEVFSPTTGLQAQLPVLLVEYKFYSAKDVKDYLNILPCVKDYFEDILEVERRRSAAGLFLSDRAVDDIISQCEDFIKNPDENFMITTFAGRLSGLSDINEDERLAFEYENKRLVKEYVIPAYEEIISVLNELKGTGKNEKGLCEFPEGKAYYEWLVKNNTGSDWSISKMKTELEKTVQEGIARIQLAYTAEPSALEQTASPEWPKTEPEEILSYLKEAIQVDYPPIEDTDYSVKYVDPSMQEHLSPAFFLTPALDDWGNLSIYINESEKNGNMDTLFTTLGHEGFPGHLYETVRFNQTNPAPIRQLLSFGGYSEGWATYAEYSTYEYAGFSESLTNLLKYNNMTVLAICGRIDIGINYDGWSLEDTYEYLAGYGLASTVEDADGIYWSSIEEPANTLDYIIGYLEFAGLRSEAEKVWEKEHAGEKFDAVAYHEKLLDLGPAPFEVLRKWMAK